MMDPQYLKSQCTRKVLLPQMQEQSFSSKQDNANLVAPMENQLYSISGHGSGRAGLGPGLKKPTAEN